MKPVQIIKIWQPNSIDYNSIILLLDMILCSIVYDDNVINIKHIDHCVTMSKSDNRVAV